MTCIEERIRSIVDNATLPKRDDYIKFLEIVSRSDKSGAVLQCLRDVQFDGLAIREMRDDQLAEYWGLVRVYLMLEQKRSENVIPIAQQK